MIQVFNHEELRNCNIQFQFHDYTLSVLIGKESYSDSIANGLNYEGKNVEISIWNDEDEFILPEQVLGHQSIESLSRIMGVMCNKHDTQQALVNNVLAVID
jgi:hypothetical protein